MELPSMHGLAARAGLMTLEKKQPVKTNKTAFRIGIPNEVADEERRVALAPQGVATLIANGHKVYIEDEAGESAGFSNEMYMNAGAEVVSSAEKLYTSSNLIVKVYPPTENELQFLQPKQILVSAIHLGNTSPNFLNRLMELSITSIGFEFIRDQDGTFPIVRMMHEITGSMSVQIAARYLESSVGGRGVMLGGISGIPPANVVILGAGVIGEWAARTALGFGANVIVLDSNLSNLRALEHYLDRRITTATANPHYIQKAVKRADVLIGAMMNSGQKSPIMVDEQAVASMKPGSVIVDVVIDQGGCIETSRPTSHSEPVYKLHDVFHYCVPNVPSNAAQTASYALTNVLVPYLVDMGDAGSINEALWQNVSLRNGTYIYRRHLTKKSLATLFGMPHRDIELLVASGI